MDDMISLQVDYLSIPSIQIIEMSNNLELTEPYKSYLQKLKFWNNKLEKNSSQALVYVNWEREIMRQLQEIRS